MATISENLQTIKNSIAAIKQSIVNKGGSVSGDISTWANSIENISNSEECSNIFTFTINGIPGKFPFEDGMTFYDYCNSEYAKIASKSTDGYSYIYLKDSSSSNSHICVSKAGDSTVYYLKSYMAGYADRASYSVGSRMYYIDNKSTNCCFIPGTKITLSNGSLKNIEDIAAGDEVMSFDLDRQEFYQTIVNKLIIKESVNTIATVKFENGSELIMNAYHPILTDKGWHSITKYNDYDELVEGDVCKTDLGWSKIVSIEQSFDENGVIMYNLDVRNSDEAFDNDTNDNFIANGIVVHNGVC